jgi:hypothetical protein
MMRNKAGYFLALFSGAILALPPSFCCLLGSASCCAKAELKAAKPVRACCQHHATSNCSHQTKPSQRDSAQICCCTRTATTPPLKYSAPANVPTLNFLGVANVAALPTAVAAFAFEPTVALSPALHALLCVWRC